MTVARWVDPNYTTQSGAAYRVNLDAAHKVAKRLVDWFAPHQVYSGSPNPDLAVELDAGFRWSGAALSEIGAQTVSGFTIPTAGQHRIDRVVLDIVTGAASRVAGTAVTGSPSATPPAIPAGSIPICQVLITSSDTVITDSMITDERPHGMIGEASISVIGLVALASQTQMEAKTTGALAVTPNNFGFHPLSLKAWGEATATGSLALGENMDAPTDTGTGVITWNLTTDMSGTNYAASPAIQTTSFNGSARISGKAAGTIEVTVTNYAGVATDPDSHHIMCAGDRA